MKTEITRTLRIKPGEYCNVSAVDYNHVPRVGLLIYTATEPCEDLSIEFSVEHLEELEKLVQFLRAKAEVAK